MKKHIGYIAVFLFLIVLILMTWYVFFYLEIISSNEKRIAGIFSILGLGFGLFQFGFNEVKSNKRKKFYLKYETYKEIIRLIDSVSETLNIQMTSNEMLEVHGLACKLLNQINQIASTINLNNDFLFPDICKTPESKKIQDILEKILLRTDRYRIGIEKAVKHEKYNMKEFVEGIEEMNWHNEMKDYLKELHENKYAFYKKLRTYF